MIWWSSNANAWAARRWIIQNLIVGWEENWLNFTSRFLKFYSRASELMSLPVLGVNGWLNSSALDDVLCKSGHMEASSSAMKVDCDGEVVSDSGSCKNAASEPAPKLFILIIPTTNFFHSCVLQYARHEISSQSEDFFFPSVEFFLSSQSCVFYSILKYISIDIN